MTTLEFDLPFHTTAEAEEIEALFRDGIAALIRQVLDDPGFNLPSRTRALAERLERCGVAEIIDLPINRQVAVAIAGITGVAPSLHGAFRDWHDRYRQQVAP